MALVFRRRRLLQSCSWVGLLGCCQRRRRCRQWSCRRPWLERVKVALLGLGLARFLVVAAGADAAAVLSGLRFVVVRARRAVLGGVVPSQL